MNVAMVQVTPPFPIRPMKKLLATWALPCLVAGCYFRDPIAQTTVVLDLSSQRHTSTTPSPADPEIKESLRIIDEAFMINGFTRDKNPPTAQDQAQGIIATYGRYAVSICGQRLLISFVEFGKDRASPVVSRTCSLLKDKLSNCFGAPRVSVEGGTNEIEVR